MSRKHHPTRAEVRRTARRASRLRNRIIIGAVIFIALITVVVIVVSKVTDQGVNSANEQQPQVIEISVSDAYVEYQAGTFLLDVREQEEWDSFHIPETTLIPLGELSSHLEELPRDQRIVVVCNSGNRSLNGAGILLDNGFTDVTSMTGGVTSWSNAGYPIEGTRP